MLPVVLTLESRCTGLSRFARSRFAAVLRCGLVGPPCRQRCRRPGLGLACAELEGGQDILASRIPEPTRTERELGVLLEHGPIEQPPARGVLQRGRAHDGLHSGADLTAAGRRGQSLQVRVPPIGRVPPVREQWVVLGQIDSAE